MSELFPVFPNDIFQEIKLSLEVPTLIEKVVSRQIVARVAQRIGLQVEPSELQQAADQFRLENQLLSAEDTFHWLQKYHLSIEDFETLIHAKILAAKLSKHLFEAQIDDYFAEHQADYVEELIRPELTEDLRDRIRADLFKSWLQTQLEQAEIRVEV